MPGKRNHHGPVWRNGTNNTDGEFRQPMICFSPDPTTAWNYSHGTWKSEGTFDLWQIWLEPEDEVHVQPFWGAQPIEVRIANRIPKRRLHWVAERTTTPKENQ